jgi:hypothetical protein
MWYHLVSTAVHAKRLACVCAHNTLMIWDKLTVLSKDRLFFHWKVVAVGLKV